MADKLSNVIGAPFSQYVIDQLYTRAARNSTSQRSTEEILFLANKTAWVRLISSVNVAVSDPTDTTATLKFYEKLGLEEVYSTPEALAKNWVLEAGTSKNVGQTSQLRYGIGNDGSYGLGGIKEMGYRPMPGLESVQIETTGRLGSLRAATIRFKVWNMTQLNVVEALYFRLGYSMLLEWGHTQFFTNPIPGSTAQGGFTIAKNTYGVDDPFSSTLDKTLIQQKIKKKALDLSGNYDGMLGIVSNFTWAFNQDGGYDCTVKLIGLGSIMDTVRINQSYKMPPGLIKAFKKASQTIEDEIARREAEKKKLEEDRIKKEEEEKKKQAEAAKPPVAKNIEELYQYALELGGFKGTIDNFKEQATFYPAYNVDKEVPSTVPDYFFIATGVDADIYNKTRFGLFLQRGGTTWQPLHQNLSQEFGGVYFQLNKTLLESIVADEATNFNLDAQERIYRDSVYTSAVAKYLEVLGSRTNSIVVPYSARIISNSARKKDFQIFVAIKYVDAGYQPSKQQLLNVVDTWLNTTSPNSRPGQLYLQSFEVDNPTLRIQAYQDLFVTGVSPKFTVQNVPYTGPSREIPKTKPTADVQVWIQVRFDNTALIGEIGLAGEVVPTPPSPFQEPNTGNTTAADNQATAPQTESTEGYESALHVMLSYVKTVSLSKALDGRYSQVPVIPVDIVEATKTFYQDGIFKNVFTAPTPSQNPNGVPFDLTKYAQKGFNSYLLADGLSVPSLYDQVPFVNFQELSKAYLVQYQVSGETTDKISYPVYITLGYLMAFLNNMCLIYDSKQKIGSDKSPKGSDKSPYIFLDFNPETNLCLTSPQQLSVDPTICLIPFQANSNQYKTIFPADILNNITSVYQPEIQDFLSGQLAPFKTDNPYQGRTMNILLNVDYLINLAHTYAIQDAEHSVNLKGYLEQIMVDVNKCLGNTNLFRVAYRDDSNTLQIKDDQFVPAVKGELTILNRNQQNLPNGAPRYGQIPVFGLYSMVREFQFKTNLSTRLSSMIAISAQAITGSVNAKDASSMSYLNQNYVDRFKPYVVDASAEPAGDGAATKTTAETADKNANNDVVIAEQFNTVIKNIYSDFLLDVGKIEAAKNYYIERLSKVKADDPITSAAIPIPADLDMTIDGISGIVMGNAFTIPEDRLPLSLRGNKVGFIVAGLVHTIENNEWLTKIKGQMIKLRDRDDYGTVANINKSQGKVPTTATTSTGCTTDYQELDILDSVQVDVYPITEAARYLKANYPDVGRAAFAVIIAEAAKSGDNIRSAGGNNFGGVQTDSGRWGFGNFNGQFCRRDSGGNLRMFASFTSPEAFLDFLANRLRVKGFANANGDRWTELYIDSWWSPVEKKSYTRGTATYNSKLAIYNSASKRYDQA